MEGCASEGAEPAFAHCDPIPPRCANTYPLLMVPSNVEEKRVEVARWQ